MKRTALVLTTILLTVSLLLSACEASIGFTEDDFCFYDAAGEQYIPELDANNIRSAILSLLQTEQNRKYFTYRDLTIGDPASKIFEAYKNVDWDYNFTILETAFNGIDASQYDAVREEYGNKLLSIKSKKEYTDIKDAQGLVENENAIIDDENICIYMQFLATRIGNKLCLYNELPEVKELEAIYNKYGVESLDNPNYITAKIGNDKYFELLDEVQKNQEENSEFEAQYAISFIIKNQKILNIVVTAFEKPE
jgi:predicted small secreted protein